MDNPGNGYLDFEAYERAKEPHTRQKAYYWSTAIGLQKVDGLSTSDYLKETAKRNIEGEISIDEAQSLITSYYQSKKNRTPKDDELEEADLASAHISKILSEPSFAFSLVGLTSIHRRIFEGIFKFAGKIRDYDITKKEWVLRGDTVLYVNAEDIRRAIEYDLGQERDFDYHGLSMSEVVGHIAKFVSGLWQIHPFGEGNTRATAVFTIKYLRSIGFKVENNLFAGNSWYFRNALVRANYRNAVKGIDPDIHFLELFFRNLLMGENNELKNRYLIINPPSEWLDNSDTPTTTPTTTPASSDNQFLTDNETVKRLVMAMGNTQLSVREMMNAVKLKDRKNFLQYSLTPAIKSGFVQMLHPERPNHPRQKYLLTVKGLVLYEELVNNNSNE